MLFPNPLNTSPSNLHTARDMKFHFDSPDTYRDYTNSPTTPEMADPPRTRRAGCCFQLGVSMRRVVLELSREPVTVFFELFIPILFTVGSIILWAALPNDAHPAGTYYSVADAAASTALYSSLAAQMCYREAAIPGLHACTALSGEEQRLLLCGKAITGTPSGLCVVPAAALLATDGWRRLASEGTVNLPGLTELILLKWAARILYDTYDLSSVGDYTSEASLYYGTGTLFFAPASDATAALVAHLRTVSPLFSYVYGGTFDTTSDAEDRVMQRKNTEPPIWGIIEIHSLAKDSFNIEIRLNNTALPDVSDTLQPNYVGGVPSSGSQGYTLSGFAELQKAIYAYYLTTVTGVASPPDVLATAPMPTVAYKTQTFLVQAHQYVPMFIVFGFMFSVAQITKRAVMEKELGLRVAMLIMGLPRAVMFLSHFLVYLVPYTMLALVVSVLLKATYARGCDFGVLFFLHWFFVVSVIVLAGLMSVLFRTATVAAMGGRLLFFAMAIPLFAMQSASGSTKTGISFLSPSGYSVGLEIVLNHELGSGLSSHDLRDAGDSPTILTVLLILAADSAIYLVLMILMDLVLPQEEGMRRLHPLFFIIKPMQYIRSLMNADDTDPGEPSDGRASDGVFEAAGARERSAVRIRGLRKEFGDGRRRVTAVDNLYLDLQVGEITVLLGHNGAGKTTTMNMMTGMLAPDGGDCLIYGKSVRKELSAARQEMGYCPQHNILWPSLTCVEHLWYYASIKGLRGADREHAISRMLHAVDLEEKAHYRAAALSGGQKRKLSVAIAFVGGSKLVFLDEPTAGMDVVARRHTWEMLRQLSQFHSILLTTHFMDEADLLGDTVAIMSKGRLQCAGSNLFLKSKLGVGYVLTMSVVAHTPPEPIAAMVFAHVPTAAPLSCGAGEVAYRLPTASKAVFPNLLECVEAGEGLGISGFSISATTLEEVFIQIANKELEEREQSAVERPVQPEYLRSSVWSVSLMGAGKALLLSQLKAMMVKRFCNARRDRRTLIFQIVIPVACVLLAMLLSKIQLVNLSSVTLSSDVYGRSVLVDVAGCDGHLNYDIPFASRATTVANPAGATDATSLTSYLSSTYYRHPQGRPRYLGLVCEDSSGPAVSSVVLFNASSTMEVAIGVHNLYNGYYQKAVGPSRQLYTTARGMPQTESEKKLTSAIYAMMIAVVVMIPFTFIPSTFVGWVVKERQCKARHLQNASGLSFYVYWLSNLLFDTLCYLVTMGLVIVIFLIFHRTEYVGSGSIGATLLVLFLYGVSSIAMAYAVSFWFTDYATAQNVTLLVNYIVGFLLVMIIVILQLVTSAEAASNALRWVFRVVPSFCVGEGIMNMAVLHLTESFGVDDSVWAMHVVGWPCLYMALELPLYALLVVLIDHPERRQRSQRLFHNPDATPEANPDVDSDVRAEEEEMRGAGRRSDLVSVQNLRKVYGNGKVAVRNLSFGVRPGEVFGFLGTNGAGKTTTISILCQEFLPTSGHARICGYDIGEESAAALRCVGYCPQFDATLDLLTVEEHLGLYAGVRGIRYEDRQRVVEGLMGLCELLPYRATKSAELSGGNRRKLSVAMSLIGGPRVVFLDEPSAGMDPVARRGLWTAIQTVADNCAVVLSTHHLEEVEALAHRVAIMVDGTLRCIGTKTHLKTKYGSGFELSARLADTNEQTRRRAEHFIMEAFPGSVRREFRARRFIYELPESVKLSETFRVLEANAARLHIVDYCVAQTSIEQVFLRISEEAAAADDAVENDAESRQRCCC